MPTGLLSTAHFKADTLFGKTPYSSAQPANRTISHQTIDDTEEGFSEVTRTVPTESSLFLQLHLTAADVLLSILEPKTNICFCCLLEEAGRASGLMGLGGRESQASLNNVGES